MDAWETCQRLHQLASEPPTRKARAEVLRALESDGNGVHRLAARALAIWGDRKSLRSMLAEGLRPKRFAWVTREAAVNALLPILRDRDASWVLDAYFSAPNETVRKDLLPLVERLSNPALRRRVIRECRSATLWRRRAGLEICAAVHLQEQFEIYARLANDDNPRLAATARRLLEHAKQYGGRALTDPLFRAILKELRPWVQGDESAQGERRPQDFYVLERTEEKGPIRQVWRWYSNGVEVVDPWLWRWVKTGPVNGHYFTSGIIEFRVDETSKRIEIDWMAGPLWGWGWTCRVIRRWDGVRLEWEAERWVA